MKKFARLIAFSLLFFAILLNWTARRQPRPEIYKLNQADTAIKPKQ